MDSTGDEIQPGRNPGPEDVQAAPPVVPPGVGGSTDVAVGGTPSRGHMILFWASFLTLIAGGIGFAVRGGLLGPWGQQYGFTQFELGQIAGAGLWGFPIAIIGLSFLVDRIGYGKVMIVAFSLHVLSAVVTLAATPVYAAGGGNKEGAFLCLYWGSFLFSLANGACESVINPLTATLFSRAKTHWLNILHAGWPGGLILGALIVLGFNGLSAIFKQTIPWEFQMGTFLIPVLIYGGLMAGRAFPHSEARRAGVSLATMMMEFAAPVLLFLILLHAMIGYVELGTDSWITNITGTILDNANLGLFLFVWTSGLMFVLRFFAGPIVHRISPLGLLFCSAVLGCIGLLLLGQVFDSLGSSLNVLWFLLLAATVYGCGKTFFWPTMLGVVSERFPKGGALTLGVVGGVGMLSAGFLGGPIIGYEQDYFAKQGLESSSNAAYARYSAATKDSYLFLPEISGLDNTKVGTLLGDPGKDNGDGKKLDTDIQILREKKEDLNKYSDLRSLAVWWQGGFTPVPCTASTVTAESGSHEAKQPAMCYAGRDRGPVKDAQLHGGKMALSWTAAVPACMAIGYLILILYFWSRGGYQAQVLLEHRADDEEFTGGVEGPADL